MKKNIFLLFYCIISLFFMEVTLKTSTTGSIFSSGLLFCLIFSIPFAIILDIISTLFKNKINHTLTCMLIGLAGFIFSSQMIYYKFFRTFYSVYSAGNGGQVFQFWKEILGLVVKNAIWILLFFLPAIMVTAFGRKLFAFKKIRSSHRIYLMSCIILAHLIGLGAVLLSGSEQYSPYDLYFKSSYPNLSMEKLGLLTTMRLDIQRLALGWSPSVSAFVPDSTDPDPTPTETSEDITPVEQEEKIEYNTMNIDFESLISAENDKTVQDMHKYFQSVQPTAKNDYTGKYKGYNLILITAESFSPYAVREDVTPTLYKMVHEGYNFTNFYNPIWGTSTTDGEYVACTGLIPKGGVWSFKESGKNYLPLVMGNQLKSLGYKTVAYHDHTYTYYKRNISHPNMGYVYKGIGNGLDVKKVWPESDLEMMEKTIPEYISNQPFHAYYMTVSGHLQYNFIGNMMAIKNKKYVENLPYGEEGRAYIAGQIELDKAMEYLLNELEKAGIADKTLIALSPDHYPYGLSDKSIDELAGHQVEKNFELYKSTFILYTKGMEPVTIDKPCSSLDIIPTISNLLGLDYDSRLLMGTDLFSDSEPLVVFLNKSFITGKGRYNAETKEFTPVDGEEVDQDYIKGISKIVNNKFYYSAKILETDYYRKIFKK